VSNHTRVVVVFVCNSKHGTVCNFIIIITVCTTTAATATAATATILGVIDKIVKYTAGKYLNKYTF
jgi:hypothetical protein